MKCRKCTQNASINMRQHRLALCKDHYLEWFVDQTQRFIKKYRMFTHQDKVLVAVSGGKDSLALWDVLYKLEYKVDGLYIDLGIDHDESYSQVSKDYALDYAQANGLHLETFDVKGNYGNTIPDINKRSRRGNGKPCSVCGLVKRHVMNDIAYQKGYTVLVTGHNLDDEVAVLFGNTLTWSLDLLSRQKNVLEDSNGLIRKTKPFCRFYERETAAYAILAGIPYMYDECPYSTGSKSLQYKELLNQLEEKSPGIKLNYYVRFLQIQKAGIFANSEDTIEPEKLSICPSCGQPTSNSGQCAFCKLLKINQ